MSKFKIPEDLKDFIEKNINSSEVVEGKIYYNYITLNIPNKLFSFVKYWILFHPDITFNTKTKKNLKPINIKLGTKGVMFRFDKPTWKDWFIKY